MRIGSTVPTVNSAPLYGGGGPNVLRNVAPALRLIRSMDTHNRLTPSVPQLRDLFGGKTVNGVGIGADAILQPTNTTTSTQMVNWAAGPVTVLDLQSDLGQIIQALENDALFKIQNGGTLLDPGACPAKLMNEAAGYCATYPQICGDVSSVVASLCSQYASFMASLPAPTGPVSYTTPQNTPSMLNASYGTTAQAVQQAAQQGGQSALNADQFGYTVPTPNQINQPSPQSAPPPASATVRANPFPQGISTTGNGNGTPAITGATDTGGGDMPSWLIPVLVAIAGIAIVGPMLSKG